MTYVSKYRVNYRCNLRLLLYGKEQLGHCFDDKSDYLDELRVLSAFEYTTSSIAKINRLREILKNIRIVGLVGDNFSGKTTFLAQNFRVNPSPSNVLKLLILGDTIKALNVAEKEVDNSFIGEQLIKEKIYLVEFPNIEFELFRWVARVIDVALIFTDPRQVSKEVLESMASICNERQTPYLICVNHILNLEGEGPRLANLRELLRSEYIPDSNIWFTEAGEEMSSQTEDVKYGQNIKEWAQKYLMDSFK